ncbi:MAG TPA: MBL fold metallo-hydrolase [Candidatus Bathyarchaeia archaeon]|nr:MBL fold metallo-hydrolase [Candidatus Bathyarchaeia archaeon]
MNIKKVTENVYAIDDGSTRGNVAAYVLPSQILAIDSGMHLPILKSFREKLEADTGKKFTTLIITHTHGDHVFGNKIYKDCQIIASKKTNERMEENSKIDWTPEKIEEWKKTAEDPTALEGVEIILPSLTFKDEFLIEDQNITVKVKNTGGHTDGSSYVYCSNYKVLTAGDNLFNDSFPWGGDKSANPIKWIAALKEYLSLDIEHFIPGHGNVSGKDKIQEFLAYLEKVTKLMTKMIAENKSDDEIIKEANLISYHPPRREQWKELTLKKWLEVLKEK